MQNLEPRQTVRPPFYRPELDVLRFFAFFSVFLFHATPQRLAVLSRLSQIGALGMCLFFVLSAFLITELLRLEKGRSGTVGIKKFYVRRVLRIWPLYLTFMLVAYGIGLYNPAYAIPGKALLYMAGLSGNVYLVRFGLSLPMLLPLWSISVEEQFYLLWPGICKAAGRRLLVALCALLVLLGSLTIWWLSRDGGNRTIIWLNSLVEFQMFGMGGLLAIGLNGRIPRLGAWQRFGVFCGATACLCLAQYAGGIQSLTPPRASQLIPAYLSAGVGACLLLVSFLGSGLAGRMKPLIYLGKISYGLYVFHAMYLGFPYMGASQSARAGLLKVVLALGLTVLTAIASYRFLESPFIRLKQRFAIISSRQA